MLNATESVIYSFRQFTVLTTKTTIITVTKVMMMLSCPIQK